MGTGGVTAACKEAVVRLIQGEERISHVRILSYIHKNGGHHGLLLWSEYRDDVAIKSGFSSGYRGEGPRGLSFVLHLLDDYGAEIEEVAVTEDFIERLDKSSLTRMDLKHIKGARPLRPTRWHDYIFEEHYENRQPFFQELRPSIPLAIIDGRIFDLALNFFDSPDQKLLTGYRRLEDIVRKRTGIDEHGSKLFSEVFHQDTGKLYWNKINAAERVGRVQLFAGTYLAYRNRRAHRELKDGIRNLLAEFLLLNHLFVLEGDSSERAAHPKD